MGDSSMMIQRVSKAIPRPWSSFSPIIQRIAMMAVYFENIQFVHVLRHLNTMVDTLENEEHT